jgi:CubicO group peptidase (beta-lactamase class C family)
MKLKRITTGGLVAFAGAAALALSMAMAAVTQAQPAEPDPASLTDVQKTSLKRLKEWLAVVNTGDVASIVSYLKTNTVKKPVSGPPGPPGSAPRTSEDMAIMTSLGRYQASNGLDLVRVTTGPDGAVVGIVRNRMTGDEEVAAVRVEPEAPHQIISIQGGFSPQVMATFGLRRADSDAVTEPERLQEIGSYLKRMGAHNFSGAVVIARDGQPVFAEAYGYADHEKKIPNTVDTPFLLGSMNKLFTGLAIGQLVEQSKLSYEDPLSKFLPDYPDAESAAKIRIKHLLSHTSGLGNPNFGMSADADALDRQITVQAILDEFERKPLEFEPGTKWVYTNLGFVLLGRVIEVVTRQDYYDYMQKHIFAPGGATSASFPLLPRSGLAVLPMALPYEREWDFKNLRGGYLNQLGKRFRRGNPAFSGIVSALDLIKLSNAVQAGRIVKPETFRLHSSAKPELSATNYGYGYGTTRYGRPFVGHGGNLAGQCTEFGELKDTPYTIVVLSNVTINTCRDVTARILRVLRPSAASGGPRSRSDAR